MFRFLCLNSLIAINTIFFCLLALPLSFFDKNGRMVHFYIAVPWAKVILWICGIKIRLTGVENVNVGVPCIYMSNHQSYFDIFALLACLPVDFKFIVKQELMRLPLFGAAMKRAGYIGIERENPRKAILSMRHAAEKIQKGASVLIFPEGTRSSDGKLQPLKKGGFKLALSSHRDIIPVAIKNSCLITPKGSLKINKGSFEMHIGKAIPVGDYSKKSIMQLIDRVSGTIREQIDNVDIDR